MIDCFSREKGVIGVHDAVNKSDQLPPGQSFGLSFHHDIEKLDRIRRTKVRSVSFNGMDGQVPEASVSSRAAKYWKVPTRIWLRTPRTSTAPGSGPHVVEPTRPSSPL